MRKLYQTLVTIWVIGIIAMMMVQPKEWQFNSRTDHPNIQDLAQVVFWPVTLWKKL